MPRISINEIDNTVYNMSDLQNDNIAYVPGTAITGPYDKPVLCVSTYDYESQFGETAPVGSPSHDYVEGLLQAGLPVLFRRIACKNQASEDPKQVEVEVKKAKTTLNAISTATELPVFTVNNATFTKNEDEGNSLLLKAECSSTVQNWSGNVEIEIDSVKLSKQILLNMVSGSGNIDVTIQSGDSEYSQLESKVEGFDKNKLKITAQEGGTISTPMIEVEEKYGGTFGNDLFITTEMVGSSVYFRIFKGSKQLESQRLAVLPNDDEEVARKLLTDALLTMEFESINVSLAEDVAQDLSKFVMPYVVRQQLTGGRDFEDAIAEAEDPEEQGLSIEKEIAESYDFIKDKYIYDVKFITAGGYTDGSIEDDPDQKISKAMVKLAETRQDCTAILDVPRGTPAEDVTQYFVELDTSYAAAFAPWGYVRLPDRSEKWMAPSFIFLYTLGRSVSQGNPVYLAPAGVLRASIPQLIKPEYEIGGDRLELWQSSSPQCINPIMKLRSYGYVIYGQKTLYNIENSRSHLASALQELNTRLVVNEIKRLIFNVAIRLTFQANNQRTWNEFKALIEPTLDSIKLNGGITDYQVKMDETTTTEEDLATNTIRAVVRVSVSRAVENFEIDFVMEPQSVVFADEEAQLNIN